MKYQQSTTLKHLQRLTQELPSLDSLILTERSDFIEYKADKGHVFGIGLYNNNEIAVQRVFVSKGAVFPIHQHTPIEWMICYKGYLRIIINDKEQEMKTGDFVHIKSNDPHYVPNVLEDTWLLCITIPSDTGYPDSIGGN